MLRAKVAQDEARLVEGRYECVRGRGRMERSSTSAERVERTIAQRARFTSKRVQRAFQGD